MSGMHKYESDAKMLKSPINLIRYIFLIGPALASLFYIPVSSYPQFILLALFILAISQIRLLYLGERLAIASVIVESILIFYFHSLYGSFLYLILFSTLIDSIMLLTVEAYLLALLSSIVLVYRLHFTYPLEWVATISLFYWVFLLFLIHLRNEKAVRSNTESLYDELRRKNYELEAARNRLLDYSKQVEKNSQLEERNRISRELHDSIGHSLTGLLMQVDAAIQIIEIDKKKGMDLLQNIYQNINASIETLRQTVRKLRPPAYHPHTASIKDLINKFSKETNVKINYEVVGTPYKLYPSVDIILYHNTQEALTNAVRHGHARHIDIQLVYKPVSIDLYISDDGIGAKEIKKGFGLSGMEERLELVDGTITYSGDNGFHIHMSIPRREV